jgi:6,7-dimethyl-8-ribityllumazine synthase
VPCEQVDIFDVPGAFEIPLLALQLARTGKYSAIVAAAFIVDGGIYRHEFVAQAVINGLMRAAMDSGVPVLSVCLTPHNYQETTHHTEIFKGHFVKKGQEAADAAQMIIKSKFSLAA